MTYATIGPYSVVTPSAMEAVLVANTPSFLLDRLRKDIGVQTIANSMTGDQIVTVLTELLKRPSTDAVQVVTAYVYLVALSWSDPQDENVWRLISSLDLTHLEWGNAIRQLMLAEAVPTTTQTFRLAANL